MNTSETLRKKLNSNEVCLGLFHLTANSIVSEAISTSPLDWLVYDMEASPSDKMGLVHFLQSMKGSRVTPLVRAQSLAHDHIEQILDAGTGGIVIPKVDDREICERVLAAIKYPPMGRRGVNPVRASGYFSDVKGYFSRANDNILVFVQIESRRAIDNIEDILDVPGVDGVFVGCGDLSMDMRCPGDMENEILLQAIDEVLLACRNKKKYAGIFAYNIDLAMKFINDGFRFVAIGNDVAMLQKAITNDCKILKRI